MITPESTSQLDARPPLRRATYIHVSDLTNVYNIDHAVLDQELSRVKAEREQRTEQEVVKAAVLAASVDSAVEAPELDAEVSPQKRLQPPKSGYNLCVLVGTVTLVVDKKRVDQSRVRLAEVEVGDETGIVSLRARDDQIDLLEEVSVRNGAIVLRNCTLELYQGKHIRLAITKWGKLSLYPDNVVSTPPPPSKMNLDRDYSSIDLSVVASEMAEGTPETLPDLARQGKQLDSGDTNSTIASKPSIHNPKTTQPTTRRGGREKRQQKSKQGMGRGPPQPFYGLYPYEHAAVSPRFGGQISGFPNVHAYPPYDQSIDPRHQYHYSQHQEQHIMAPTSSQHAMMQRQYELHQMHHIYQGQQDRSGTSAMSHGQAPQTQGIMMQPIVPAASFDANEFSIATYPSTASSPILIPVAMPSSLDHPRRTPLSLGAKGELHSSSSAAQETHSTHCMSVSPDDSSHLSARMNVDAATFAPVYLGAAQVDTSTNQMYLRYDPSNTPNTYPDPRDAPMLYPHAAMMYPPGPAHQGKGRDSSNQDDSRKRPPFGKGKGPIGKK